MKANPVLWDPTDADYKNRDVRRNTWNQIDAQVSQIRILGETKTTKEIWDDLMRGFANALRRSQKRGNTHGDKEWKFENDMSFLMSAKKHRLSGTGFSEVGSDTDLYGEDNGESSFEQIELKSEPAQQHGSEDEDDEFRTIHLPHWSDDSSGLHPIQKVQQEIMAEFKAMKRKRSCNCDCATKKRSVDALDLEESPRLNFFRSLMPIVVSLDDDQFLNLQLEVIRAVQKVKNQARPVVSLNQDK